MRHLFHILLLLISMTALTSCHKAYQTVKGDPLQTRIYTLENGLTVYLSRNQDKPEIQTFIAVHAGAQNDPQESTGLAHYLEHMMFKGTTQYGTTDFAAEKPYLDQIDSLYEQYSHTTDAAARKAIYHLIDSISFLSSQIAIANEFDKLMDGIGATEVNAFTGTEMTCYHEVIPAGELNRWAAIESGRFKDLVIRGFHTELEAVYEEFNLYSTMDNSKAMQAVNNILYPELSYRQHEVIGTQEHLQNPSLLNVKKFYDTYYRPNNVAICLSGDFEFDEAIATIRQYFGDWRPNPELPHVQKANAPTLLTSPIDSIVLGNEAPMLWLAWRFPGVASEDNEIVDIIGEVLQNGKCGLFDRNIDQQQRTLGSYAFPDESGDYTTFYLLGMAKEGQTLDEVRQILLEELRKLKNGDFSEEMLQAIIANKRKAEMYEQASNEARCMQMVMSFINNIPWETEVGKLDRQAMITKEDIMRVANAYFTDGYAAIYKQQGVDPTIQEISKPAISPIEMNRGINSAFADSIMQITVPALKPQFLDFEKDLTRTDISGRELLYRQNTTNQLFTLCFISNGGSQDSPILSLAGNYIDYLGTESRQLDELQAQLYALAGEMNIQVNNRTVQFSISGLQENLPATLALLEDKLLHSVPDDAIYAELVNDLIQAHEDSKQDQRSCFYALYHYGMYGASQMQQRTLTPRQMRAIRPDSLTAALREKALHSAQIVYYGPATEAQLKQLLTNSPLLSEEANLSQGNHIAYQQVSQPEVLVAPYDAPTIYYNAYANWGETYDPKQEALIMLFNQYFCGSMGSVVFQEMRESRALAYSASAYYYTPSFAGENNYFVNNIISQTDKLQDCVTTFAEICNNMPQSESTFAQAKSSILKQIEQQRYTREAPLWSYIAMQQKGWNHDYNQDIYREAQALTMDDLVRFQQEHVGRRTYRYLVLGDPKKLDMNYLKTLGNVNVLTLEDIFIY